MLQARLLRNMYKEATAWGTLQSHPPRFCFNSFNDEIRRGWNDTKAAKNRAISNRQNSL